MRQNAIWVLMFVSVLFVASCTKKDVVPPILVPEQKIVLPHFYIQTDDPDVGDTLGGVKDKKREFEATLRIDGKGEYEDYEGRMKIRGRGNSTWKNHEKKPYRLILDQAAGLLGYAPYEDWVLLNEYLDGSMLYNSVPFTMGEMLGIDYVHHVTPVEITFNGEDKGIYVFMEHKEVGRDRIDIDPETGLLLEIDTYYDEEWKFHSEKYELPIMVQYPKKKNLDQEKVDKIAADFNEFEELVYDESFPDNTYLDYFDEEAFIKYLMVYLLTLNEEINSPHSTYIHKRNKEDKYRMGIIWDFDWGFGYANNPDEGEKAHYRPETANHRLFWTGDHAKAGSRFFSRLMEDPYMRSLYHEKWKKFRKTGFEGLKSYVRQYAEIIRLGYEKDHEIWGKRDSEGDLDQDLQKMLNWLDARANVMDNLKEKF